jgi:hypothetical protein
LGVFLPFDKDILVTLQGVKHTLYFTGMKKIILLAVGTLFSLSVSAQIKFPSLEHDFGTFNEGEMATHKFVFKNEGKTKVSLKEVRASCGCTTPQYTKKELAPGDTGSIVVTYNSNGRPGMFTKNVTVVVNDSTQAPIILQIKGDVKSKNAPGNNAQPHNHDHHNHDGHDHHHHGHDHDHNHSHNNTGAAPVQMIQGGNTTSAPGKLQAIPLGKPNATQASVNPQALPLPLQPSTIPYLDTLGALAFENINFFGQTFKGDEDREISVRYRNVSQSTVVIGDKTEGKACFQLIPTDKVLSPGMESSMKIKFISAKAAESKLEPAFKENLSFFTNEKENNKKTIFIEGTFQKKLTAEELANAPKITFVSQDFDAGEILAGEELVHKYQFTNTGKSDLVIESAKASCGCTVPELKEKVIKPGQTSYIEAKFNSTGRSGPQHKNITVTSNDPANPRVVLNLKCTVKEDPFGGAEDKKLPLNDNGGRFGSGR